MEIPRDNGAMFDIQGFLAACKLHSIDVALPLLHMEGGQEADPDPSVEVGEQAVAATGSDDPLPPGRPTKLRPDVQADGSRSFDDQDTGGLSSTDPSGAS